MIRWLILLGCGATSAILLFGAAKFVGLSLPWVVAMGVGQAGIMWWRGPWAVGTLLGMTLTALVVYQLPLGWALVAGLGLTVQGIIPAVVFTVRRLPYDMAREVALNIFLLAGVLVNGLVSGLLITLAGWQTGLLGHSGLVVTIALLWLVHSVTALIITLPLLRFGTHILRLHGIFGTPAALQRGICPPMISRHDLGLLALMVVGVGALSWGVTRITYLPPQFITVLFLLPIVVFTAMRGLDGALLSATSSLLLTLVFVTNSVNSQPLALNNERVMVASIVFELGVYYLISLVGGVLIDGQRAERRRLKTLLDLSRSLTTTDETTLVQNFADSVLLSTNASACVVTHYDPQHGVLTPLRWSGTGTLPAMLTQPLLLQPYPMFVQAIENADVLVLHSDDPHPPTILSAFWATTGYTAGLLVPLVGTERVVGVVGVFDLRPERVFTPAEVRLMEAMCSQAAAAFEQRRLIGALRDQTEQLSAVSQITAVLNATLDLDVVCRRIARQIARVVPHEWACVALVTSQEHSFRIVAATGTTLVSLDDDELLNLDPAVWAQVAAPDAVPLRIDLGSSPTTRGVQLRDAGLLTVLLVPLRRESRWLGLLMLASSDDAAFPETQQHLLQMLSRHMALAIANAKLYAELEQTYRAKQEAQDVLLQTERLRALGELSSGIAHDFNNILAGILGHTQLLLMEASDHTRNGLLVIEQAARDGTHMVQRIQHFARARQAQPQGLLNINAIVDDVLQLTRPRWRNRPHDSAIETVVEASAVPQIYGSDFALREVLTNLVLNAVDAMPLGGQLTIRTTTETDSVSIQVADTGIGMSEATQARMWEPFFSTKGERGTGLGLTMVHAIIVQHHGGRLLVQSAEGVGTTITLLLPTVREEMVVSENGVPASINHDQSGHILLVESDARVQLAIVGLLGDHYVVAVDSGAAAMAAFAQQSFDIVLADSGLTDMSVWDLVAQLKERAPYVKAVLLTVWAAPPDVDQRRHVFDAVLPKPFESSAVQALISTLLASEPTREPA